MHLTTLFNVWKKDLIRKDYIEQFMSMPSRSRKMIYEVVWN